MIKSVSDIIENHRAKELQLVKDYILSVGGDGLVCPGECGCSIDDLFSCGLSIDEELYECVPAKGKMGEWEGMECMVYFKIDDKVESIHDIDTVKCSCCGAIGPKLDGAWSFRPPAGHPQLSAWWHHCPNSKCPQANPWQAVLVEHWDEYTKENTNGI